MAQDSVFGEIPGNPPGTTYADREAVKRAGLQRHLQGGISGHPRQGADAIIVSGGYVDDRDYGDRIIYTGQGGRATATKPAKDQELSGNNLALAISGQTGLPVRVIRGAGGDAAFSPKAGYRYDGLYVVVQQWSEIGVEGKLVQRYVLEASDGGASWVTTAAGSSARPVGRAVPTRTSSVVQRVVRNSVITQWVKDLYSGTCQICGTQLQTPVGFYSEGAHIRALGAPHDGPDTVDNVLCLCPNDHVLFDKGALYIADEQVFWAADDSLVGDLLVSKDHGIDWSHAAYHREHFARAN